jgi:hypothetical protein
VDIIKWLDSKLPASLYRDKLAPWVSGCECKLSLSYRLNKLIDGRLDKNTAWTSEMYQLFWLAGGVASLTVEWWYPTSLGSVIQILALYRSLEIVLFAISWVFIHREPLHSYKRSLASFGVNMAELIICFAVIYLASGCVQCNRSISTALYLA